MTLRHAMPVLTAVLVSFFLSAMTPKLASAQGKIAVVDLQRAINETEEGRKAKDRLKKLFESRQQGLDKKQEELKKLKEEIDQKKDVLARDALAAKVESYQKQLVELQQVYVDYQRELAEKEGELTKSIIERMEKILRRIGQSEGYALIVERNESGVIFAPTNLDLTDLVIQKYNSGEGAEKAAAATTTPPQKK